MRLRATAARALIGWRAARRVTSRHHTFVPTGGNLCRPGFRDIPVACVVACDTLWVSDFLAVVVPAVVSVSVAVSVIVVIIVVPAIIVAGASRSLVFARALARAVATAATARARGSPAVARLTAPSAHHAPPLLSPQRPSELCEHRSRGPSLPQLSAARGACRSRAARRGAAWRAPTHAPAAPRPAGVRGANHPI